MRLPHSIRTSFTTVLFAAGAVLTVAAGPAHAADGLLSVESPHDVNTTLDRLETVLGEKGMNVFGRVDHGANADSVDLALRPTALLIFGNPKVGTPLMNCSQSVGIDLPQKMLAWEDEAGTVHLGWNDPAWLAQRHGVQDEACMGVVEKVTAALQGFAAAAVAP